MRGDAASLRVDHRNVRRRRQREQLFEPSDGARLTFREMSAWPPSNPPEETFNPELHPAISNPSNVQVLPPFDSASRAGADVIPPIYLLRESGAQEAYALVDKKAIKINHRGDGWGEVIFGVVYKHEGDVSSNRFRAPSRDEMEMVAIKKLNRAAVAAYLARGGEENPYKEICRMQALGDNIHVLKCRDALYDDDFLYIITPKACEDGTLVDAIPWLSSEPMDSTRSKAIFRKILQILAYLEANGICHRDFTPDNFLFLTPDNLVAFDLALSHRLPKNAQGTRVLTKPLGNFGTHAYMAPEVFQDRIFCGVYSDLWSAAIILYNLHTNLILYHLPLPDDISFLYNILARGLSSVPINERTVEVLQDIQERDDGDRLQNTLFKRAMAHLNLSGEATILLENLLAPNPNDRWTLAQAMESAYVQSQD